MPTPQPTVTRHRHRKHHRRRRYLKLAAALLLCVLLGALLGVSVYRVRRYFAVDKQYTAYQQFTINGQSYRQRDQLLLLVVGLDDLGPLTDSGSYENNRQADFLALLALDRQTGSYSLLHIDRDTMTEVDLLSITGSRTGRTVYTQIALSHNYGNGLEPSAMNTRRAVSNLLYGLRIDNYLTITMEGLQRVVDHFGGIPVTMDRDHTDIDPAYTAGATPLLDGEKALAFVRARKNADDGTNAARMQRQRLFMEAFVAHLRALNPTEQQLRELFYALADTDGEGNACLLTDTPLRKLQTYLNALGDTGSIYTLPGTHDYTGEYAKFYPDGDGLAQLATQLYYTPTGKGGTDLG